MWAILKYLASLITVGIGVSGWVWDFTKKDPTKTSRRRLTRPGRIAFPCLIVGFLLAAVSTVKDELDTSAAGRAQEQMIDQMNRTITHIRDMVKDVKEGRAPLKELPDRVAGETESFTGSVVFIEATRELRTLPSYFKSKKMAVVNIFWEDGIRRGASIQEGQLLAYIEWRDGTREPILAKGFAGTISRRSMRIPYLDLQRQSVLLLSLDP